MPHQGRRMSSAQSTDKGYDTLATCLLPGQQPGQIYVLENLLRSTGFAPGPGEGSVITHRAEAGVWQGGDPHSGGALGSFHSGSRCPRERKCPCLPLLYMVCGLCQQLFGGGDGKERKEVSGPCESWGLHIPVLPPSPDRPGFCRLWSAEPYFIITSVPYGPNSPKFPCRRLGPNHT